MMYYEEEIIDGVLMWRGSPDGEWQPVSGVAEQYLAQKEVIAELERRNAKLEDALEPFADAATHIPENAGALDIDFMLNGQADCTTVAFEGIAFHRARALLTQEADDGTGSV